MFEGANVYVWIQFIKLFSCLFLRYCDLHFFSRYLRLPFAFLIRVSLARLDRRIDARDSPWLYLKILPPIACPSARDLGAIKPMERSKFAHATASTSLVQRTPRATGVRSLEIPRTLRHLPHAGRADEKEVSRYDSVRHDNCALRADNGNQGGNDGKRERASERADRTSPRTPAAASRRVPT